MCEKIFGRAKTNSQFRFVGIQMKITVEPASHKYQYRCIGSECQRLPEFIGDFKYDNGYVVSGNYILPGTVCAKIDAPYSCDSFYWCRDCIDREFQKIKAALDSNLWIFR